MSVLLFVCLRRLVGRGVKPVAALNVCVAFLRRLVGRGVKPVAVHIICVALQRLGGGTGYGCCGYDRLC